LKTDRPRLLHFGVADETAWEVGLACGGSIDIFVAPFTYSAFDAWSSLLRDETEAVNITVVRGPQELLGRELLVRANEDWQPNNWVDIRALDVAKNVLSSRISRRQALDEAVEVFVEVILPSPVLVLIGGVHIAIALVSLAKTLGYRTIVIDPRKAWANQHRFPLVDQLIPAWPEEALQRVRLRESTAVVMLTHDPKLDDVALRLALPSPAFYVGALGSRATQLKRRERLRDAGITEAQLSRLRGPIGLDIGAESPEEIALAIMAEIVEARRRQPG
jgi:xanthine dehydrogenase accessory factor